MSGCEARLWLGMAALAHPAVREVAVEGVPVSETLQGRRIGLLYAGTAIAVFALMCLAGLAMRLSQAPVIHLSPTWLYRLLTLHGIGLLTSTLTAMMGASCYVLLPRAVYGEKMKTWNLPPLAPPTSAR